MEKAKNVFVILSGKGGVGKSSISSLFSLYLCSKGNKVALIDADLCNPNLPIMFKVESNSVMQSEQGWVPVSVDTGMSGTLSLISSSFLMKNKNESIVLRGPKKRILLNKFVSNVSWGEVDYFIIDTPPGTSEELFWVVESLKQYNLLSIIVTTSQNVSVQDNKKMVLFCQETELDIVGIIENMSGFVCPHCKEKTNIFSKRGGEYLSEENSLLFIGRLPLCPFFVQFCQDSLNSCLGKEFQEKKIFKEFFEIGDLILKNTKQKKINL